MTDEGQNNIQPTYAGYLSYFIPLFVLVKTGTYLTNNGEKKSSLHGGSQQPTNISMNFLNPNNGEGTK